MKRGRLLRVLRLLLAFFVSTAIARAQAEPDLEQAKRLFREGNELRKAGDCEGALALYLRSKTIVPSAQNTTNAAYCAHRLGRWDQALELYEELVARFSNDLSDEERRSIAPEMAELRKRTGSIDITANVEGNVVIDGRPRGRLPLLGPLRALTGRRRVQVLKDGWETFETFTDVRAGESSSVNARLVRLTRAGRLRVETADKSSAEVHVDGVTVGLTPWEGTLAPGDHVVWILANDRGSAPIRARVIEGQVTTLPLTAAELGRRFAVEADPSSAQIRIDGVAVGPGSWTGRLPRGRHVIEAHELGYLRASATVSGESGGNLALRLEIDERHPRWRKPSGVVFATGAIGAVLASGVGSGAEASCDRAPCDRNLAFGGLLRARVGYELQSRFSVHASVGYFRIRTELDRTLADSFADPNGSSDVTTEYRLKDEITLSGPFAGVGVSQRWPIRSTVELSTGLSAGAALLAARDSISGTGKANGQSRPAFVQGSGELERSFDLFVAPEIEAELRVGRVHAGVGLALFVFLLEGRRLATGDLEIQPKNPCVAPFDTPIDCAPGEATIAREKSFGRFVAVSPYLTARYDF